MQVQAGRCERRPPAVARLYTIVKVARDQDFVQQIGKNIYFDLVDHDKVTSFRVENEMPFSSFKERVAEDFGVPVHFQRFWLWAKRKNHTYRPHRPLTPQEEAETVGQLTEIPIEANKLELKLFLEVDTRLNLELVPSCVKTKEEILLFFKLYDPFKEELRYVGRMLVKGSGKPLEILNKLNELAGFDPDEEIELFEEIRSEPNVMCIRIDKNLTFLSNQLDDGDIICFQKSLKGQSVFRYPKVPSFFEYVHTCQVVRFRSLEKPKEDEFYLLLPKQNNYDEVVESVARHLSLDDPSKVRLTSHNCCCHLPKQEPIKYQGAEHLTDMLRHYNQTCDILYYEVLDIPLPELQELRTLRVAFQYATKDEVVVYRIRLPKQSAVADVIADLKTKVELSHPNAELRLLEVSNHKIFKAFSLDEKIANLNDIYWSLRAEEIPEEDRILGPGDHLVHVYHFIKIIAQNKVHVQNFGEPFLLKIHESDTLAAVKLRVQNRLRIPNEEFSKWKFTYMAFGRLTYLRDTDIVATRFKKGEIYGCWQEYLGLEHPNNAPEGSSPINPKGQSYWKRDRIPSFHN